VREVTPKNAELRDAKLVGVEYDGRRRFAAGFKPRRAGMRGAA
jgi:hypothetical protein